VPELPEVETVCRGVSPHLVGKRIESVIVRNASLRWPVPDELAGVLRGQKVKSLRRRAKYLLFEFDTGWMVVHLGMSGRLYLVVEGAPIAKHDHVDWLLSDGKVMRYTDPRRFGAVLWIEGDDYANHVLLSHLGPEPLAESFSARYLYHRAQGRKVPIKTLLMDGRVVVGVGNIYANEALFMAGIHPNRASGAVSLARVTTLVVAVKAVLAKAIEQGGTTLKDFVGGDGKPGYFKQELQVYGRGGQPCYRCDSLLKEVRIAQRTTVYCPRCQH
jgi:formamidopyrimidine-DNA glycosylase